MHSRRLAVCIVASLLLTALSLAFAEHDLSAALCAAIGLFSGSALLVCAIVRKGRQRVISFCALAVYLIVPLLLLEDYSWFRDRLRWLLFSGP